MSVFLDKRFAPQPRRDRYEHRTLPAICVALLLLIPAVVEASTKEEAAARLTTARIKILLAKTYLAGAKTLLDGGDCAGALAKLNLALGEATAAKAKLAEIEADWPSPMSAEDQVSFAASVVAAKNDVSAVLTAIGAMIIQCAEGRGECCPSDPIDAMLTQLDSATGSIDEAFAILGTVPAVSEWGLIVVTLLAMTLGTIMIARRRGKRVAEAA